MMKHVVKAMVLAVTMFGASAACAQENITLSIRGVIERQAHLYEASGGTGAVLAHQSGYDAASWRDFANRLQKAGVTALALESVSGEDVGSGIDFLRQLGKRRIVLIGASIGGAAVQSAAWDKGEAQADLVILLGTAEGNMADAVDVDKLFVVSEGDFFRARTHSSFQKASEPKELMVYPGSAHGQDLFNDVFGEKLAKLLLSKIAAVDSAKPVPDREKAPKP
ncbi:MAG: hypothetical protein K5905_00540 [Roseibium sp.]|uniref:alpha/beta hydrolase n=1 Tax=Roseibium sp. TaxID=1936156 RepID=UPI00262C31A2|nr:hypothetical protein [Roseibium sp.]MCV0423935.1 hypothetical protein [Roseibium sp.]